MRITSFDLETTGTDTETARIVTATVLQVDGESVWSREWLVNPGIPIPPEAAAIHGVTDQVAAAGVHPSIAAAQILIALCESWCVGIPVVIFNASYDLTVLDRELGRHCNSALEWVGAVLDPFVIDKHLDKYRKGKRTLAAMCASYQVTQEDAHTATGDALATARLAWRMLQGYPQIRDFAMINQMQAEWRRVWALDFEDYLRRSGKSEHIDGAWPMRPRGSQQ